MKKIKTKYPYFAYHQNDKIEDENFFIVNKFAINLSEEKIWVQFLNAAAQGYFINPETEKEFISLPVGYKITLIQ